MEDTEALMGKKKTEKEEEDVDDPDKDKTCCCCCGIKSGMTAIGVLTVILLVIEFVVIAHYSASAYFDMYYWMVCLVLLAPLIVAVVFWFQYWCCVDSKDKDSESSGRTRLVFAQYLVLASALLLFIWNLIYIYCLYGYDDVYVGYGDPAEPGSENDTNENYYKISKMDYTIEACLEAILIVSLWGYFVCVAHNFSGTSFEMPKTPGL